ncbi:MAG: hypothetical protein U1E52_19780 [Geminicoccaceae bacterium]
MRRRGLLGLALAPLAACDGPEPLPPAWAGPPARLRDPVLRALAWGRLAPSACNAQPWQVALAAPDRLILRADPARALPVLDPDGRQARIALGAFVELAVMAAAAEGRRCEVTPLPDGAVALRLTAASGPPSDPLFAALPRRRTTRLAYDLIEPVKPGQAAALRAAAGTAVRFGCVVEPERVAPLRELARQAHELAQAIPEVARENAAWLRLDDAAEDGIPVRGAPVRWARALGLLSAGQLADPTSLAFRMARLQWANLFAATASFGWIATLADGAEDRLAAGRAYQRVDLAAAAQGLAIHPVSEALGNVPALGGARGELERLLGAPGRVQMLFRLGRAGPQPPTPRRPVEAFTVVTVE